MGDRGVEARSSQLGAELIVDAAGHRRLFTTTSVRAGEVVVPIDGVLHTKPSRYSIQVDANAHLDQLGVVEATNHSCEPTAYVDFSSAGLMYLRAMRDLPLGTEVTIDYCATEEEMASPFRCDCGSARCYGRVAGYRFLGRAQRGRLARWLSPYLAVKYGDGHDAWSDPIEAAGRAEAGGEPHRDVDGVDREVL